VKSKQTTGGGEGMEETVVAQVTLAARPNNSYHLDKKFLVPSVLIFIGIPLSFTCHGLIDEKLNRLVCVSVDKELSIAEQEMTGI